jgi:hypothetical protein
MWATSFMGSTLERSTFVHHCRSRVVTMLICLRSRISRNCSRYCHARAALDGQLGERASSSAGRALAQRPDHLQAGRAKVQLSRSICHYNEHLSAKRTPKSVLASDFKSKRRLSSPVFCTGTVSRRDRRVDAGWSSEAIRGLWD